MKIPGPCQGVGEGNGGEVGPEHARNGTGDQAI